MKRKNSNLIEASMRNRNIVIVITILLMITGVIALYKMPRNEFPKFTIRQGVIVGIYPGATSAEVEAQLTKKVENYIFGYQEVRKAKTYSLSKEGVMYIFVELDANLKNADQFWSKLKHGLNELKMTLPSGVVALVANTDFGDTSALLITLSSDTKTYKELEDQLKKLEEECRKIPATSKIKHFGLQKEKIFINVKPELLNEYNIKTISLLGSYQLNGMVNYAGELKDGQNNLAVHLPANFSSEKELAEQIIYSDPNNNVVRLKNIASIERKNEDPDSYIRQNGMKTVLLSLEMQPGNNIVEFGEAVSQALSKFEKTCPKDIKVAKISELPKYVQESVNDFMKEFFIAIVAVILVTMILLPFRVASVAGITVPISVMMTLAFLYFFGIELHTVSLASLILVLGMIVDNSIVVIDNHVDRIDSGISPWHSAIVSAKDLAVPIIGATLAIIASYVPLGFMIPGTAGEFIMTIPIVVSVALVISVGISLLLVPYLNFIFIKKGLKHRKEKNDKKRFLDRLQGWYDSSLEKGFRRPKTIIITGAAIIIISIIFFKMINQQLFPEMERNQFAIEVYLPTGSSLGSTAKIMDSLETVLLKDKRVTNVTSFVGTSSPRFHTVYAPNMPSPNYGQLLINTTSSKVTREVVNEYRPKYADAFPNAHVKFKILALQGFKAPLEIRISSDSIKDIRTTQAEVEKIIGKEHNLLWVRNDWDQKVQSVRIGLDKDKVYRQGYSKGLIATSMMAGLNGIPLTTIWEDDYPVEVRLIEKNDSVKNINTIKNQYINSLAGFKASPVRSFAQFTPEWTEGTIVHRNGTRTLTILADNNSKEMASAIFDRLKPQIERLKLPEGTSINYGGEYEGQVEVFFPMGVALALSILLIFLILLFQFRKIKISLLIMSTMLLTLPGAVMGLYVMGYPFGITAFIGITSLCGMVVRNGIILIDYARELVEVKKMPLKEAAIAAGKRRMRPIFLTSAAASVGVIPMILSRSPLWGPLGTVICFGLIISMVLTLYILPVLFSFAYSNKPRKQNFWSVPAKTVTTAIIILFSGIGISNAQTLSLDSCKHLTLLNNNKIKSAENDLKASTEQRKNAFTNYFPKITASAIAMRSTDYLIKGSIPSMKLPVFSFTNPYTPSGFTYVPEIPITAMDYFNTANIMATMPLYTGGRIYNGNKLAHLGEEISREKKELVATDAVVRTEELYRTLISLKEKEKTLLAYSVMLDSLHKDISNYTNAGLAQKNDLLKVQIKQNEIEVNKLKLSDGIKMVRMALAQNIGIKYNESLDFSSDLPEVNSVYIEENSQGMVSSRIEYKMLNQALDAGELEKKMVLGECLPQLALTGTHVYLDIFSKTQNQDMALLTLSVPITDWWGGTYKTKEQNYKIEKARTDLRENTELLALQIQQSENDVKEAYFQIKVALKSLEQSEENLRITNANYKAGTIGISDLLEAYAILQSSKDSLTENTCNYYIKKAKYLQSMGKYK